MLGGFKFAIHGELKPVYRRPRFDYGEGLLSGPAWAGVLAVLAARRNALRAWLGESAVRSVVVGALAAGLGIQASTTPSVAHNAAKGHTNPPHSSAARHATGGGGPAAGILKLSGSDGDHRADAGNKTAAEPAPLDVGGGQGRRLSVPGMGAAPALGERIDLLSDLGLFDLFGADGSNSSSGRPGNDGSGSRSSSNSGEPGSASDSSVLGSIASSSSGLPSDDDALPGAGGVFGWQAGWPIAVSAGRAGSRSVDIASGLGPDIAAGPTGVVEDLHAQAQGGGGSADLGPSPSGGPAGSVDAPGPGGVPEAFPVSGGSGAPGGVPEPATWATMLVGLALIGGYARQRRVRA